MDKPRHGFNLLAFGLLRHYQTGANRFVVQQYRTSPAIAGIATDLHVSCAKPFAQRFRQPFAGANRGFDVLAIEPETDIGTQGYAVHELIPFTGGQHRPPA